MAPRDVVCLSHLPWGFALERPHQVMRRFARDRHVFFVEAPVRHGSDVRTVMRNVETNVHVVTLHVPAHMPASDIETAQRRCVSALTADTDAPLLWVYAPSMLPAARDLAPSLLVYDCVEDHAGRRAASADVAATELDLLRRADLVFTAGTALFDAKRGSNVSTYPLPSSVDAEHFAAARGDTPAGAGHIGFLGTIDDRVELGLVDTLAAARPDLQISLLGGLRGVTTWDLPDRPNVHWLGAAEYGQLPDLVASWDVAILPFRSDAATRRTEPSGLLACLAAGKAVVTTPLDEVAPLAGRGLVSMVDPAGFVGGVEAALEQSRDPAVTTARRLAVQGLLARTSWDRTCGAMMRLVGEAAMIREVAARRRDSERMLCSA